LFSQVQNVLDELNPLIESVGVEAELLDAIDGVATLKLSKSDVNANADMTRLKGFIERELMDEVAEVRQVVFEGLSVEPEVVASSVPVPVVQGVKIDVVGPEPEADTCVITLDQVVGPMSSAMFETIEQADDWPLMRQLMAVEGVAAIMVQDKMIVLTRTECDWGALISACTEVIRTFFGGEVSDDLKARVQAVLDKDINPAVAMHGGQIELLDVKGTEVYVHMGGGCQGCGQAALTLKHGVQSSIIEAVPEITAVFDTTDHAAGSNPYFRGSY
jgi:Fe-S cluster biogenesis protein NfuA